MRAGVWLAVAGLLGCGSVEVQPDDQSGEDGDRGGAQQLPLDKLVDDYIDFEGGDATDWKFFKVKERGILELTIYWDNKEVESVVDVRDRFGVLLDSRKHTHELEKDKMDLQVEPGTHFIRLTTSGGASVYTIEGLFKPFDFKPSDDVRPVAVEIGEDYFDDGPRPEARSGKGSTGRVRRGGGPRPPVGERPQAADNRTGVSGTIQRISRGPGGKGSVATVNIGREQGLKDGQAGVLLDQDGRPAARGQLSVRKVRGKNADISLSLTPEEVAHRRAVRIYVQ